VFNHLLINFLTAFVLVLVSFTLACQEGGGGDPQWPVTQKPQPHTVATIGVESHIPENMRSVYWELADYLRGKDVAMVGPAPNLVGTGMGSEIDAYDVVCRVNNSFIINEEMVKDYGARKDILFNSGSDLGLAILKHVWPQWQSAKYVMLPGIHQHHTPDHDTVLEGFQEVNMNNIPVFQPRQEWFMGWQAKIDKEKKWNFLNTGLSSIRLLLEFEINSLTIYGFTFYKGGKGYVKHQDEVIKKIAAENPLNGMHYEPTGKSHKQHKQKQFFRQYIESDPRIIFVE
tara:strand:+ start:79 stop:936 length:858 start_codon:yes stop_codon:yes gene_type:complete